MAKKSKRVSDTMLNIIGDESKTLQEFARRAEAYASVLSYTIMDTYIADAYRGREHQNTVLAAIRNARKERLANKKKLWNNLANNINKDVE